MSRHTKRLAVLLAVFLLLPCAAMAAEAVFSHDVVHAAVESLFAAAAGTTQETEVKARKKMSEEDQKLRSQALAEYRRQVLPWLLEALRVEEPVMAPDKAEEVFTLEDSYAALQTNALGAAYLQSLLPHGGTDADSCMAITRALCQQWMAEINPQALRVQNAEYAFWMYLPDSPIDYPVVHGTDNQYYLNHLFNGRRSANGTLFADWRNLPGFRDPNTLIYGHHMRNRSMFGCLDEYERTGFYESHPYVLFIMDGKTMVMEIFAAYTTDRDDHCYEIGISAPEALERHVRLAKQKSAFPSEVQIKRGDRLVTLSTCAYAFEHARFVVIGKLRSCLESIPVEKPLSMD